MQAAGASYRWLKETVCTEEVRQAETQGVDVYELINAAIERKECPGAVLVAGNKAGVVYEKAYGHRALEPAKEAMTPRVT